MEIVPTEPVFTKTIKKVEEFKKQVNVEKNFKWVADSALYAEDKLLKQSNYLWLTRVPETIKEAKTLTRKADKEIEWEELERGYRVSEFISHYGNVEQRWLLVYSEQAYEREKKTLEKKLKGKDEALKKSVWHLSNEIFDCEEDARKTLEKLKKNHRLHVITGRILPVLKYAQRGKPKAGEEKKVIGYKVESEFTRNEEEITELLSSKGRFILATNDLDKENFSNQKMLCEYKEQQNVEGGFRFIKDPWFMVDSIFLKSPKRIEALMMVMTLCLMIYNIAQYKLR